MEEAIENQGHEKLQRFKKTVGEVLETTGRKIMAKKVDFPTKGGFCQFAGPNLEGILRDKGFFEITLDEAFRHAMIVPVYGWNRKFAGFRVGPRSLTHEYRFRRYGISDVE